MQKRLLIISGFSGALAITLGAMGAHALKSKLPTGLITETNLQAYETASRYHIYHTIVLLILVLLADKLNKKLISASSICFIVGIILFSGSIYILSTSKLLGIENIHGLGIITPIGGLFFIAGWLLLGIAGIKHKF